MEADEREVDKPTAELVAFVGGGAWSADGSHKAWSPSTSHED